MISCFAPSKEGPLLGLVLGTMVLVVMGGTGYDSDYSIMRLDI